MRMYKKYLKCLCSTRFILEFLLLLITCCVHNFTRYKVCRSVSDLFYWPEGPCLDMIVVLVFLIDALLILIEMIYKFIMVIKEDCIKEDIFERI